MHFPLAVYQFIRGLLNAITAFLVPKFLRPTFAQLKTKYPVPYRVAKAAFWSAVLGGAAFVCFVAMVYLGVFGKIPNYYELKNLKSAQASELYGSDGKIIGKYYLENRTNITYEQISPLIINALVATEDKRFFDHGGLDLLSVPRVVIKSLLLGNSSSGGGSTISQQLAKNLFGREHKYGKLSLAVSKIKELILAQRLEKIYTKNELLTSYLNTVSFGEDTYGIENAALLFFNKKPKDVTVDEAAALVGTLKAPSSYNPRLHPEKALPRRNVVMKLMQDSKYINKAQYDSLSRKPLHLKYNANARNAGIAPYFREKLRLELDTKIKDLRKPDGKAYNLYTDGLKIYTTIDTRMQGYAEEAVAQNMAKLQKAFDVAYAKNKPWGKGNNMTTQEKEASDRYQTMLDAGASEAEITAAFSRPVKMKVFSYEGENNEKEVTMSPWDSVIYYHSLLSSGFLAMDPRNGHILAWVGGVDFKHRQYDHVTAKRQVGSTFKPIVYAAALEHGQQPCDYFPNEVRTYPEYNNWRPENSENSYGGAYSMKGALTKSLNTITVQLMVRTGVENVIDLAKRMGIQSDLPTEPSIALGAGDISLKEMITAYGVLANMGIRRDPVYLLRIEDRDGKILKTFDVQNPNGDRVLPDSLAQCTVEMMRGVINNGTGARLRSTYGLRNDIAGKTGTTQNQTDGWFIGFTPNMVAGAWVGGDDPAVRFRSLALGQGANTSLPMWGVFMQKVYADASLKNYRAGAAFAPMSDTIRQLMNCPDFMAAAGDTTHTASPPTNAPLKPIDPKTPEKPAPPVGDKPRKGLPELR
jgi:penicillin-binding protein 1A